MDKLTVKQEKFAQCLFSGMSQREAYKATYDAKNMKDNVIDIAASKLFKNPKVTIRLEQLTDELKERNMVTVEWVLNKLKSVCERCMQEEAVMTKDGDEYVESGVYKFEHSGANKSLELLGKHLGMFTDKIEHSGEIKMPNIVIGK